MNSNSVFRGMSLASLVIASAFVFNSSAYGPVDRGNGSDQYNILQDAAWFVSQDRSIKTCIEMDSAFGVTLEDANKALSDAIATWRAYIQSRAVSVVSQLNLNFEIKDSCYGDEDLVVFFGVNNQRTSQVKSYYDDPIAFAYRESYDERSGWGRGFIWVSGSKTTDSFGPFPNWKIPNTVLGILIHELGHVLGVPHRSETIMDADIRRYISEVRRNPSDSKRLAVIDHGVSLLSPPVEEPFDGMLNPTICNYPLGPEEVQIFTQFVGRPPSGQVRMQVKILLPKNDVERLRLQVKYKLTFKDDLGSKDVIISSNGGSGMMTSGQMQVVFKTIRRGPGIEGNDTRHIDQMIGSSIRTFLGSAVDNSGHSQSLIIAHNMSDRYGMARQLIIEIVKDNAFQRLFSSLLPEDVEQCSFER